MWNVRGSSLANCKPRSLFILSSLILGMAFCPQAHSGQANVAYLAGGCFWCTEAVFEEAPGVTSVTSGYMQGAETIQVTFDPAKTNYDKLLILFWEAHDPTQVDRQGPDVGNQYRTVIFYHSPEQEQAATASRQRAQERFGQPIMTSVEPATGFWRAEEYHQCYLQKRQSGLSGMLRSALGS